MATHHLRVGPLPTWLDAQRLLGEGPWTFADLHATASLPTAAAADLAARLRGLVLAGAPVQLEATPPLPRAAVRSARTEEARRHRDTSVGFSHPHARLDEQGRYSLTPERLALSLGNQARGATVLDAGCGAGGNTIGFARAGCKVIAVERDAARLSDARHNAACYGVEGRVRFVHGDAMEAMQRVRADVLFVDPPWGAWDKTHSRLAELPLLQAAITHRERFLEVWAKVPPSFDTRETPEAFPAAVFGHAPGDRQRIKFLWLRIAGRS